MNRLQRMGNKLEEMRKKEERKTKRYWKLSPIERMEYDQKRDRINEKHHDNFFVLTIAGIKVTLLFFFLSSLIMIDGEYSIGAAMIMFKLLAFIFFRVIMIAIGLDILYAILDIFFGKRREKEIKKLDKRFKL